MSSSTSMLTATQRSTAGALFSVALHQAQIQQCQPLGTPSTAAGDGDSSVDQPSFRSIDSVSDHPRTWVHESTGLLRPVFKVLEIDSIAWNGLEETAGKSPANQFVGSFIRMLAEESCDNESPDTTERKNALINGVDKLSSALEKSPAQKDSRKEKQREYENVCRQKFTPPESQESGPAERNVPKQETKVATSNVEQDSHDGRTVMSRSGGKAMEEAEMLSYPTKVLVLYNLLSGCLADIPEEEMKSSKRIKGYDARHRVALRLLATWFDIKWIKMEAIETMLACSAMSLLEEEESKGEGHPQDSSWDDWKRGSIIGAAAVTGGTLMAITGGLAAPAIAAGFSALAPTVGTIIPVVGAHGLAAVASAAGSAAGSVAVAASFGAAGAGLTGTKVARRIGDVDGFEFKAIGENHNQGRLAVEISVSGFVFEEEDFIRPWEEQNDNLERYALLWESKNLIAVSTAIQDWLTSKIAMEMMKRGAMLTVLSTLMTALTWPSTLLSLTDFIDNQWAIAIDRSDKAGKMLAEVLLKGLQGHRPVTLVGFSLGARVVFSCLKVLAESENSAGLVERVVLLGAPIAIQGVDWEATRKVVSGRYVNVYSSNDWMLGVVFRANLLSKGLAGLQPVDVPGIENVTMLQMFFCGGNYNKPQMFEVDVTEIIDGHSSYLWNTQEIVDELDLDNYYPLSNRKLVKP